MLIDAKKNQFEIWVKPEKKFLNVTIGTIRNILSRSTNIKEIEKLIKDSPLPYIPKTLPSHRGFPGKL